MYLRQIEHTDASSPFKFRNYYDDPPFPDSLNKLETFFESENPPTTSPSNDPWGCSTSTSTTDGVPTSTSSDLQDIDLFCTKPASPVDKNAILGLFGNQPTMPPRFGAQSQAGLGAQPGAPLTVQTGFGQQGFGGSPAQQRFGVPTSQPGFGVPTFQPGYGSSAENPFRQEVFHLRPGFGGPAPNQTNPAKPWGAANSGMPAPTKDPFEEPVLAPTKIQGKGGRDSPKPPADAFGDLCQIKTKSADKTLKQLLAQQTAATKKPINELAKANQPQVQASSEDPFGTFDSFSLPDAANFKTK
ncbi:uncharacterized protein [Mytilus edulis]|uniref:uncharacterized protein n=1 Tax=Mytilus edulis TaxID=6550 RepID=UPI0039EE37F8